ncbi:hypothetical protein EW093_04190 [Thiospirochaeta perfilievii]|uniref:Uncharacterized protein n=1 Tax=Thiospirochaeta perfilievii TaxID=252967 RepID=A0A5C1Q8V1_9SPIO|nr:hypothetical protein [Thiospirochaeta perfilievii]QEN03931.1 hypothetical protein EW093_04190 [Thiospirochaeta perfilievii]
METTDIKAEEILILVLDAKKKLLDSHKKPTKVIMHSKYYKKLKLYRATLGDYPEGMEDYLTQDKMFGLDICIDNNYGIQVTI